MAACGDDGTSAPADSAAPSTVPSVSSEPTTSDTTDSTEPQVTDPPTTTAATTAPTSSAASTAPPAAAGWTATDFVPGAFEVGYSGNWEGGDGPSPAAPTGTEPPADGYYIASAVEPWDPDQPDELSVRIQRLEWCSALPDGCQYMEPTEMNLDPSWQLDLDLPLDETTDVVVFGFSCWDVDERKEATGVELAELFSAYAADYDVALAVAAAPTGGFVGEETICPGGMAGPLRYVHDDAPVLLMQTASRGEDGPLRASDLVRLAGVQYTDGNPLFYFYAGFMS